MTADLQSLLVGTMSTLIASFALLTNALLLYFFCKYKDVRKNSSRFQFAIIFAEIVYGIGSMIQYVDLMRISYVNDWYTSYHCAAINSTMLFGGVFLICTTLCLSLERFLALCWPIYFRAVTKSARRFAICVVSLAIFCVIFVVLSFYGINNDVKPVSCVPNAIRIPALKPMLSYFYCFTGMTIVLTYGGVFGLIKYRRRMLKNLALYFEQNKIFAEEIRACRIISVIVVSCSLFYVIPNIVLAILTICRVTSASKIGLYVNFFASCNTLIGLPLYLWRDGRIRQHFVSAMHLKETNSSMNNNYASSLSARRAKISTVFRPRLTPLPETQT